METVRVALMGGGTVGSAFAQLLPAHQARFSALGVKVELARVLVRDIEKSRPGIPSRLLTNNPEGFLDDVDVLVEVAGGTTTAGDLVLQALEMGLPVVTANKALLAERWNELREYAEQGDLHYEASVMAGTPIIGALQSLWGNQTLEMHGIVNGTCSYLIRRMEEGATYEQAFKEAGDLGYLEADPNLDVGGIDSAHKICVLGRLTVDPGLSWEKVLRRTRGIQHLTPELLRQARAEATPSSWWPASTPKMANGWRRYARCAARVAPAGYHGQRAQCHGLPGRAGRAVGLCRGRGRRGCDGQRRAG